MIGFAPILVFVATTHVEPCTACDRCIADQQQTEIGFDASVTVYTVPARVTASTFSGAGNSWARELPSGLIGECTTDTYGVGSYSIPAIDLFALGFYIDSAVGYDDSWALADISVDARPSTLSSGVWIRTGVEMLWYGSCGVLVTRPSEAFARATDHVVTMLERWSPTQSYSGQLELVFDISPMARGKDVDRCCAVTAQSPYVPRKYFARFRAVARDGSGVLLAVTRQGNITVTSGGVTSRQGIWTSSEMVYATSASGSCENEAGSVTSFVLSRTGTPSDDLGFTVTIPGEPTQIDMYREFFEIAAVRGDVVRDSAYDSADLFLIQSLVGTYIDDDPEGVYDPDGDLDLDGDIDQDDVDAFFDAFCPADVNDDHAVDFSDYLEYLNLYGTSDPMADLNGDSIVDFADQLIFLDRYAAGC